MQKYSILSRAFHWLMGVLIISMIGLGLYMTDMDKNDASRLGFYNLHKSIGAVLLVLILLRILNRFASRVPPLPESFTRAERILSHVTHIALYVLMFLVPFSGYLMSNSFGYPVHIFSIPMPNLVSQNEFGKFFGEVHEISAITMGALVVLHVAAAFKHAIFDAKEKNILRRIL